MCLKQSLQGCLIDRGTERQGEMLWPQNVVADQRRGGAASVCIGLLGSLPSFLMCWYGAPHSLTLRASEDSEAQFH